MSDRTHRSFLIPLRLVNQAARDGISLPKLQDMLRRSARVTHPQGNRRYHDVVFMVEGQRVLSYTHEDAETPEVVEPEDKTFYKCGTCKDDHRIQVFNECPYCEGEGCKRCDDGLIPDSIPCPDCTKQKPLFKRRK